jgi:hypothetical protein
MQTDACERDGIAVICNSSAHFANFAMCVKLRVSG